jgi:hypothetical protein
MDTAQPQPPGTDEQLEELLRADAAAVLDDDLDDDDAGPDGAGGTDPRS